MVIILQGEHTSQTEEIRRGDVWKWETPGHWNGGYHLWKASRKWLIIFDYLFLSHNKTIWFFNYAVFRLREDNFPFFIKTYRMNWKATKYTYTCINIVWKKFSNYNFFFNKYLYWIDDKLLIFCYLGAYHANWYILSASHCNIYLKKTV